MSSCTLHLSVRPSIRPFIYCYLFLSLNKFSFVDIQITNHHRENFKLRAYLMYTTNALDAYYTKSKAQTQCDGESSINQHHVVNLYSSSWTSAIQKHTATGAYMMCSFQN